MPFLPRLRLIFYKLTNIIFIFRAIIIELNCCINGNHDPWNANVLLTTRLIY